VHSGYKSSHPFLWSETIQITLDILHALAPEAIGYSEQGTCECKTSHSPAPLSAENALLDHECKRRVLEDEATEREASRGRLAFRRRVARAASALVSSALGLNNLQPSRAAVRRFEWYADGAGEFLRFVELGCYAPRCRVPSAADAFVRNLAAGRKLQHVVEVADRSGGLLRSSGWAGLSVPSLRAAVVPTCSSCRAGPEHAGLRSRPNPARLTGRADPNPLLIVPGRAWTGPKSCRVTGQTGGPYCLDIYRFHEARPGQCAPYACTFCCPPL
jgi:hypothetical protein